MQSNNTSERKKKEPKTTTVKVDGFEPLDSYINSITLTKKIPSERDANRVMSYARFKEGDKKHLNITTLVCLEERVDKKTKLPTGEPIGFCPDWEIKPNDFGKLTATLYIPNEAHERNANNMDTFVLDTFMQNPSEYYTTDSQKMVMENKFIPQEEKAKFAKGWQRGSIKYSKDPKPNMPPYRFQYELPLTNETPAYNVTIVDKDNNIVSYHDMRGRHILAARYTKNYVYYQEDKNGWTNKWSYIKVGDKLPPFNPEKDTTSRITRFINVQEDMNQLCEEDNTETSRKRKEYDGMPELDKPTYESMNALEQFNE